MLGDPVGLSVRNAQIVEGSSGTSQVVVPVDLGWPSESTVTVSYTTVDSTANSPGDYVAKSGTLTFVPGAIRRNIRVDVIGDTAVEPTERFEVHLSTPSGADIVDGVGVVSIQNDD